jgi:hypothetical protein
LEVTTPPLQPEPDAAIVTWASKDAPALERAVAALAEKRQGPIPPGAMFRSDAAMCVLDSLVELRGVPWTFARRRILNEACAGLPDAVEARLAAFRAAVASAVQRYMDLADREYRIIIPLNADPRNLTSGVLCAQGLPFEFVSWTDLRGQYGLDEWLCQEALQEDATVRLYTSFAFTEAVVRARGPSEALAGAYEAFELLRAVLNYEGAVGRNNFIQIGHPQPLGGIRPAPMYGVFLEDRSLDGSFVVDPEFRGYSRPVLSAVQFEHAGRLLNELGLPREVRQPTIGLVEDALRMYGRAVDTAEWRDAYLNLWQALEAVTCEPGERHVVRDVCERACVLVGEDPVMVDLVRACCESRHELVHRGEFTDDLLDVRMLKEIVERCIAAVYQLRGDCPDWDSLAAHHEWRPRARGRKRRVPTPPARLLR